MVSEILRKIGLSEGEIKVYSALLDTGSAPINIIHEKTGIERRNIYDIINKLIERGLVEYITENKRRIFQVANPQRIINYIEEKKQDLEKLEKEIEQELPSLLKKFRFKRSAIGAGLYRGTEGIKSVWEDMLDYKELRWIGSGRYVPKKLPNFYASWNRRRLKNGMKIYNIFRYEMRKEVVPYEKEYVKFLPKEFSGNPVAIGIYGNKVVNFMLGDDFFAFVIESREIAENYKKYHNYLWDKVAT